MGSDEEARDDLATSQSLAKKRRLAQQKKEVFLVLMLSSVWKEFLIFIFFVLLLCGVIRNSVLFLIKDVCFRRRSGEFRRRKSSVFGKHLRLLMLKGLLRRKRVRKNA